MRRPADLRACRLYNCAVRDTVLVLTRPKDGHSDLVIGELARRGVPVIRFNTEDYPQRATIACSLGSHGARQLLTCDGREHDLDRVKSVWNRRPRPSHVSEDLTETDPCVRFPGMHAPAPGVVGAAE